MPTFFNFNKRKGVFMIPAGATKSPTPAPPPAFNNTKSLSYDGVDESVHLGTNLTDLKFTGAFTLSCWVKFNSLTGIQGILEATSEGAVFGADGYLIWKSSGNTIQFYIRQGGSWKIATSTTTVTTGAWYHIGATWDGVSTSKIYINGIEEGSNTTITSITYPTTTSHNIGGYQSRSGSPYIIDGLIDEVSFYNTALSDADISTIATAPSDLSTYNPIAWYRMGDNSTYQTPQILMPENTNKDKVSNWSLDFDGVDDVINFGTDTSLRPTTALAISFWLNGTGSGDDFVFRNGADGGLSNNFGFGFRVLSGANDYRFVLGDGSSNTVLLVMGVLSGWNHFLCNWDGTTMELFINGSSVGTTAFAGPISYSTGNFLIGDRNTSPSKPYLGLIDEVAIWNSDQSANVSSIYNGGEPTTISGSTAYWKLGEQAKFTDNWLVPNSALSNYSNYSFNFDGVDDYISANKLNLTTAISISCWVKTTTTGLLQAIVNEDRTSGTNRNWLLYVTSSNKVCFLVWHTDGTNTQLIRSTALEVQDGNWHNILVTWDGTTNANQFKSFVDGGNEESKTATSTGIRNLSPYGITIASLQQNAGFNYSGNIDEVAIWNSDQSANVSTIYNGGSPSDLSTYNPIAWYRMGDNSTYQTPQILMPENTNKDKVSNYSLTFDGVDDYIDIGNPTELQITGNLTLSAWVKRDSTSTSNNYMIIGKDNVNIGIRAYGLVRNTSTGKAQFNIWKSNVLYNVQSTTTINNDQWYHIMGVNDGSDLKIYVNGVLENTNVGGGGTIDNATIDFEIGRRQAFTNEGYWNGSIDEVAVWNSDQSANISSIYNGGTPTTITGATAYWKLGEQATFSTNWTIPDQIGSNDGTSANMTIEDRVGDASNSSLNAVSFNMESTDIDNNVPT